MLLVLAKKIESISFKLWLFLFFLTVCIFFLFLGYYVRFADPVRKAEGVVMLMGKVPDRVLAVETLYTQGFSNQIFLVQEDTNSYIPLFVRGVDVPLRLDVCLSAFSQLGIPDSALTVIKGSANSTLDESLILKDYLSKDSYLSNMAEVNIIIITSPAHTRRAHYIFERVFRNSLPKVKFIIYPSPYGKNISRTWFLDREETQEVLNESIKILIWFLYERWTV